VESLAGEWRRSIAQQPASLARWEGQEPGDWTWQPSGLLARGAGKEWTMNVWHVGDAALLHQLSNFLFEISVSGKANAAGISFGAYKDFLGRVDHSSSRRRLQLEVDSIAGTWSFRIDGQLMARCWWDSAVNGTDDIVNGVLTLKARSAEEVLFEDFCVQTFSSSYRVSVIITCHRFQQRLRVCLRNWCHQNLPSGAFEILVVNPESPDGTHELLAAAARGYPHVRIREVPAPAEMAKNKGAMINLALRQSRGEWIWLTDADCLFPLDSMQKALRHVGSRTNKLFFGQRRHLAATQTDCLLAGRLDGLADFSELSRSADHRGIDNFPWGYTQILHRSFLQRVSYPEHINSFNISDDLFVSECRRRRLAAEQIPDLFCLHLNHPFSWHGTGAYL
jgi:hypothetical protein